MKPFVHLCFFSLIFAFQSVQANILGFLIEKTFFRTRESKEKFYLSLAKNGDSEAQFRLFNLYESEYKNPEDGKKAAHWLNQAARHHHARAQFLLGLMHYQEGLENVFTARHIKHDLKEAAHWLRRASELNEPNAQTLMIYLNADKKEHFDDLTNEEIFTWLHSAASKDHLYAQYLQGVAEIASAESIEQVQQGLVWLHLSSQKGMMAAKIILGTTYIEGRITLPDGLIIEDAEFSPDLELAEKEFEGLVSLGLIPYEVVGFDPINHGVFYRSFPVGELLAKNDVPPNFKNTWTYYEQMALRGDDIAKYMMAVFYYSFFKDTISMAKAYAWLNSIDQSGLEAIGDFQTQRKAADLLEEISLDISEKEVAEALDFQKKIEKEQAQRLKLNSTPEDTCKNQFGG